VLSNSATNTSSSFVIPETGQSGGSGNITSTTDQNVSFQPTNYFFDAILRVDHFQELTATRHPVQNGAPIVDHAYLQPARVVLEIGMSDALAVYSGGQFFSNPFSGNPSKSVSAYQALITLQELRIPLQLTTRLNTYQNMLIESIRSPDDLKTRYGLRATITFIQILTATVVTNNQSARPNASQQTNPGTTQPTAVPQSITNNNESSAGISSFPTP
jgi:hypothetical protein